MAEKPYDLALLFTGHMIDLPGRTQPRFPNEAEPAAWLAIRSAIERARARNKGRIVAVASGARGGDLIFHEACRLFGIERRMVLPFPPDVFLKTSVGGVPNGGWEVKFWDNWNSLSQAEREVLLPAEDSAGYALCNDRMVELAQALAHSYEIIALWDGNAGDGPGGTQDHVDKIRKIGGKIDIIDPKSLIRQGVSP
jgi:hypothetical protein